MDKKKLPDEWEKVELGEICQVKKGSSITKATVVTGQVPVIAGGQQPAYYHNYSNRSGETVTVSGSGAYAGFVAYFNIPIFASDCSTIQTDSKELSMKYIYYFLKGTQKQIYCLQRGIAQPHVYPKDLIKIKIPLPPISTQKKIVAILEKAEKAKEWRKQADKLTDDFLKSVFLEMFGDERKNTKKFEIRSFLDVFNITTGKLDSNASVLNGKYPFFTCSQETFKINKYSFDCEALLLAGNNAAAKYSIKYYKGKFDAYQRTYVLTLKNKNELYSFYHYQLEKKLGELQSKSIGTNTKYLTLGILRGIKVICPPFPLQQKFASIVKEVEAMKKQQKHSKEQIDNLFNALMQKAFKGELVT